MSFDLFNFEHIVYQDHILVNTIIKILPPVSDETCTGRLGKVLEELEVEV